MRGVIARNREINSRTVVMAIDALFTRKSHCTTFVVRYFSHACTQKLNSLIALSSPSMVSRTLCLHSKVDIDLCLAKCLYFQYCGRKHGHIIDNIDCVVYIIYGHINIPCKAPGAALGHAPGRAAPVPDPGYPDPDPGIPCPAPTITSVT